MEFEDALRDLGFALDRRTRGGERYSRTATPYLTYYVQVLEDGTALFTWELAIAEYVATLGLQVGSDEHLNTFLYPREDARGPRDGAWVAEQMDRTETLLRSISLAEPGTDDPLDSGGAQG